MHIPSGFSKTELGDIDVIAHGGRLHVFYLSLPSHDQVGHLVSEDAITWTERPAALTTGEPGDFDDDQIWTMGVCRHGRRFLMLYTGLSRREQGKVQRIGLAESRDLETWKKFGENPVLCADPAWYETTLDKTHRVDWRDPAVWSEDGVLHAMITARARSGAVNRRGCVAHAVSRDGRRWKVRPPLHTPNTCYDFETPALCKLGHRYYLTGIHGRDRFGSAPSVYRIADHFDGPYRRPADDQLLPAANLVFTPCKWNGRWHYFHNLRGETNGPDGNQPVTVLPPPKLADTDDDGSLVLRPFDAWDPVAAGAAQTLAPQELKATGHASGGRWRLSARGLSGHCSPGLGAFLFEQRHDHVILECRLDAAEAAESGIVLGADKRAGCGTFVSWCPARRRVQLYTEDPHYKTPHAGVTYRWRGRHIVQEGHLTETAGPVSELRIVAYGPYVEVSLNQRVVISAVSTPRRAGLCGVFAEDGRVCLRQWSARPLRAPAGTSSGE